MVDSGMAENLVNVDRETPMLLPVDMRDWVPENDLVHFVISAVETMGLGAVRVNTRGSGSKQYPPSMLLALMIYCYAILHQGKLGQILPTRRSCAVKSRGN